MKNAAHQRIATETDYRALAEFRFQIRKYIEFSDRAAKAAGIEPRQYQLLLAIRGMPTDASPTVGALAEQLHLRHHSMVELIDRAEKNDLVSRERRGSHVLINATPKGARILARIVDKRLKELRVAGPALVEALQQLVGPRRSDRRTANSERWARNG